MAAKVLVVDDERIIVKGLRYSLQQEGYEVDCAYDGEEAVNAIREKHFDIVPVPSLPDNDSYSDHYLI